MNRSKHDLYLLMDGELDQNAVVLQSGKNWFNPLGHAKNKAFMGKLKNDSELQRVLDALASRRRRRDDKAVGPGDVSVGRLVMKKFQGYGRHKWRGVVESGPDDRGRWYVRWSEDAVIAYPYAAKTLLPCLL